MFRFNQFKNWTEASVIWNLSLGFMGGLFKEVRSWFSFNFAASYNAILYILQLGAHDKYSVQ